jgi:hypothetical protein
VPNLGGRSGTKLDASAVLRITLLNDRGTAAFIFDWVLLA